MPKLSTPIILGVISVVLAAVGIFTAAKLYQLRNEAVAPNAPESKPEALATFTPSPTPALILIDSPTAPPAQTPSPTPTLIAQATPSPTPVKTKTPSPTPIAAKTPTPAPELPASGIGTYTIGALAVGATLIFLSLFLAL